MLWQEGKKKKREEKRKVDEQESVEGRNRRGKGV